MRPPVGLAIWPFSIVPAHLGEDRQHFLHGQVGFIAPDPVLLFSTLRERASDA